MCLKNLSISSTPSKSKQQIPLDESHEIPPQTLKQRLENKPISESIKRKVTFAEDFEDAEAIAKISHSSNFLELRSKHHNDESWPLRRDCKRSATRADDKLAVRRIQSYPFTVSKIKELNSSKKNSINHAYKKVFMAEGDDGKSKTKKIHYKINENKDHDQLINDQKLAFRNYKQKSYSQARNVRNAKIQSHDDKPSCVSDSKKFNNEKNTKQHDDDVTMNSNNNNNNNYDRRRLNCYMRTTSPEVDVYGDKPVAYVAQNQTSGEAHSYSTANNDDNRQQWERINAEYQAKVQAYQKNKVEYYEKMREHAHEEDSNRNVHRQSNVHQRVNSDRHDHQPDNDGVREGKEDSGEINTNENATRKFIDGVEYECEPVYNYGKLCNI